jgi:hypothetical protein
LGNVARAEEGAMVLMYAWITVQKEVQVSRKAKSVSMSHLEKTSNRMSSGRSCIPVLERLSHGILSLWEGVEWMLGKS